MVRTHLLQEASLASIVLYLMYETQFRLTPLVVV